MMVREDRGAHGKALVLGLDDPAGDLVAQNVRDLLVHVPVHQLAGAEPAGQCLHEEAAGRALRPGLLDDRDLSVPDVASDPGNFGFWIFDFRF
jgi:hypothetical protein